MIEIIYGENFQYSYPHVSFYLEDRSGIPAPTSAPSDTAVLVTGLLAPEGFDDSFVKFSGGSAPGEFDSMYGDISIKKHGLPGEFAKNWIHNGGAVIAHRLTCPEAGLANALVNFTIEETEVELYVSKDGELYEDKKYIDYDLGIEYGQDDVDVDDYVEMMDNIIEVLYEIDEDGELEELINECEEARDEESLEIPEGLFDVEEGDFDSLIDGSKELFPMRKIELSTYKLGFEIRNEEDLNTPGELDVIASGIQKSDFDRLDDGDKIILPLFGWAALGRGKWGNNLRASFTPINKEFGQHQGFRYQLMNLAKGEMIDSYEVSHVPDLSENGIPVNLPGVVSNFSNKSAMSFYEDDYNLFDDLFIEMVDNLINELMINNEYNELDDLISDLETQKERAEREENCYLDNMELFGDMFGDNDEFNMLIPNEPLTEVTFSGGDEGTLKWMRNFDWDYTVYKEEHVDEDGVTYETFHKEQNDAGTREPHKPIIEMYEDLYSGVKNRTIMDLQEVDGDLFLDVGYPDSIKNSIAGLINMNRQDLAFLSGIPTNVKDLEMLDLWHTVTQVSSSHNEQVTKIGQTCEWRDDNGDIHRVPISALLYLNLIDHFSSGYDEPFAGQNVVISGVQPGTMLPDVNSPQDREDMQQMNFNVVIEDENDNYILDGQRTNYFGGYSRLAEFFNIPIKGRIMKTAIPFLESRKHLLDTPDNVEDVRSDLYTVLSDFYGSKVKNIDVVAGFQNEQAELRGDVTIKLYVDFYGSIKRYRLLTYIV